LGSTQTSRRLSFLLCQSVSVSAEHHNSETEATHLWPMEELVEEDVLSFVWLSVADTAISQSSVSNVFEIDLV